MTQEEWNAAAEALGRECCEKMAETADKAVKEQIEILNEYGLKMMDLSAKNPTYINLKENGNN